LQCDLKKQKKQQQQNKQKTYHDGQESKNSNIVKYYSILK